MNNEFKAAAERRKLESRMRHKQNLRDHPQPIRPKFKGAPPTSPLSSMPSLQPVPRISYKESRKNYSLSKYEEED